MKIMHVLGHNSNWNIDSYNQQGIGDSFLITAFTFGDSYLEKKKIREIIDHSMIDLQFYGKKESITEKGNLSDFDFHPANCDESELTSVYFSNCLKQAIDYQTKKGFKDIIIPHFYENEEVEDIIKTIKTINQYVKKIKNRNYRYFMTLPFANHIIINKEKVEEILFECTDMDIVFDGFFITCENKPEFKRKVTTDLKIIKNLSRVFKVLKKQNFKTIYAYANWDALIYLAQIDIDVISIGTYENLRNFSIKRFTENESGGASKGYYFSEKLLNLIRADDLTKLRLANCLDLAKNERNIFSDIVLNEEFNWNIHKPDVNKNYLLSVSNLLKYIASISDHKKRKEVVLQLIDESIKRYNIISQNNVFLEQESENYHLNTWKTYLTQAKS
jgi:hypothetical protein